MTTDETHDLPAGPELDAMVAPLAGYKRVTGDDGESLWLWPHGSCRAFVPAFSEDVLLAFQVLEGLRRAYQHVSLCGGNGWGLTVWNVGKRDEERDAVGPFNADTPALAICRTAAAVLEARP